MRTRRHQAPAGQLSLWGTYELEAQAVRWTSRRAPQVMPTLPAAKQTESVRLMPSFRAAVSLIPTFIEPISRCQNGPSIRIEERARGAVVIEFQAVSRPSEVQKRPDLTGCNEGETSRSDQGCVDRHRGQKLESPHDFHVGRSGVD